MKEMWKDIPNYEGSYQASNLGMVRSLDRTVIDSRGGERFYKGEVIEGSVQNGYRRTNIGINGVSRTLKISQIVAMTFLCHEPNGHGLVVDHINGDRSDDRAENLRIVTHRSNLSTCFRADKGSLSSEHVGVNWDKGTSKWVAKIQDNGVQTYLGLYNTEIEASHSYQLALSKIEDGSFNSDDYKPKYTSEYKGVSFHKASNKWVVQITENGKRKHIGYFLTELEAHQAYQDELNELNNTKKETHGC